MKKKTEAGLTPTILEWFRENYHGSCAIEIKATQTNTIPESALQGHQKAALLAVCMEGIVYKISDEARRQQPFDAFKLCYTRAYVVACFVSPGRRERVALVIDVREWKGANRNTKAEYRIRL